MYSHTLLQKNYLKIFSKKSILLLNPELLHAKNYVKIFFLLKVIKFFMLNFILCLVRNTCAGVGAHLAFLVKNAIFTKNCLKGGNTRGGFSQKIFSKKTAKNDI